jgi:hypothetical protein
MRMSRPGDGDERERPADEERHREKMLTTVCRHTDAEARPDRSRYAS